MNWLVKTEPEVYPASRFAADGETLWDGVRNHQARAFLQAMQPGDAVLVHHSGIAEPALVALARVAGPAVADPTAFDAAHSGYDPKATVAKPIWAATPLRFERLLRRPLTLAELKADSVLAGLELLRKGSRLSVQPVSDEHLARVLALEATA